MRGAFYIVTTICGDFFLYSVCVFSFLFFGFFFLQHHGGREIHDKPRVIVLLCKVWVC
jgi:hypothetical protein